MSKLPTNYRQNKRRREQKLLWLVLLVLVIGGAGLIGLIWGAFQALQALACLVPAAVLIAAIWLLLSLAQKFVDD